MDAQVEIVRAADASDCPDARALEAAVTGLRASSGAWSERVVVEFSKDASAYVALIRTAKGERVVRDASSTCEPLAGATALAIALMLDDAPPPPPPLAVVRVAAPIAPPARRPPARTRFFVEALGVVATGANGDVSAGGVLEASVRPIRVLSIGLGAFVAPLAKTAQAPGEIDVSLFAVHAPVCLAPIARDDGHRLAFCVAPALGALVGDAHGYTVSQSATRLWAAVIAEIVASGPLVGPLGWTAHASPFVPLTHEGFAVAGVGTVYPAPVFGFFGGIGLALSFR